MNVDIDGVEGIFDGIMSEECKIRAKMFFKGVMELTRKHKIVLTETYKKENGLCYIAQDCEILGDKQ